MPVLAALGSRPARALDIPYETYTLDNGLHVILHQDPSLPEVVVNVWYRVGSHYEVAGRSGFAHLFEHLMFMGTNRLPGSGFDDVMEAHGGWNNAWTSEDATDYFDVGPSNLLDTLLWMEADRMEQLGSAMTKEKLDLQRDVVRNERRQTHEDEPYGKVWLELPLAMYPEGHPYAHPVIGSHEDLIAASVTDVKDFFATYYVPNNASLVVAGDFDTAHVKQVIASYFGPIPSRPLPERPPTAAVDLPQKPFLEIPDQVQIPQTMLVWHSPAVLAAGDADLDVVANVLGGGRTSRLYQRLVQDEQTAVEIDATQYSSELSSAFIISAMPNEDVTLEALEKSIQDEVDRLAKEGPTAEELQRIRNQLELSFVRALESVQDRASALNRYWALTGNPGYLETDLARYRAVSADSVKAAAGTLTVARRAVVRTVPKDGAAPGDGAAPEGEN